MSNTFAIVLPARYGATRFPGKPLAPIAGKPLIEWVYRSALRVPGAARVVVATDDARIEAAVRGFGGEVVLTRGDHATGTDRVAEAAAGMDADIIVNLQGDEPVFDPTMVTAMVERLRRDRTIDIATACHAIDALEEIDDPNVVKVVFDRNGTALYFSRSPIPQGATIAYRHVGVYAFRREALLRFASLPPGALEATEKLEQLRALENGMRIGVVTVTTPTFGVDVPGDIKKVEMQIRAD